jgi:hypothetical protein
VEASSLQDFRPATPAVWALALTLTKALLVEVKSVYCVVGLQIIFSKEQKATVLKKIAFERETRL